MRGSADSPACLPRKLAYCATDEQRLSWVRAALLAGRTVTDVGLWLGGVDDPKALVRQIMRENFPVLTFRKKVLDAAGECCTVMAWRLREG